MWVYTCKYHHSGYSFSKHKPDGEGFRCRWSAQLDSRDGGRTAISLCVKCITPHFSFMKAAGGYRTELNWKHCVGKCVLYKQNRLWREFPEQSMANGQCVGAFGWPSLQKNRIQKRNCWITQNSNETRQVSKWDCLVLLRLFGTLFVFFDQWL